MLVQLGFGPDDPLLPASRLTKGADNTFVRAGLSRDSWRTTEPIRKIFRTAFARAGLPYANPHSFRNTLVSLGERLCGNPEHWKAWSQNLGHESEATTFVGYGHVPAQRQADIIQGLGVTPAASLTQDEIAAFNDMVKRMTASIMGQG